MRRRVPLLLASVLVIAGCGQAAVVKTVTISEVVTVDRAAPRRDPTLTPKPKPKPKPKPASTFRACDQNIVAMAGTTTCGFAQNAFYEYWRRRKASAIAVLSPALGRRLDTICTSSGGLVRCTTDDGGVVRFPERAVDAYTPELARAFAATYGLEPPEREPGDGQLERSDGDLVDAFAAEDPGEILEEIEESLPDWSEDELPELPSSYGRGGLYDWLTRTGAGRAGLTRPSWAGSTPSYGYGGLNRAGFPKNQYVRPYRRSDGTYVRGYWRNSPTDGLPTCKVVNC